MSETPGVDLMPIERLGGAIVARPQVKMLDPIALRALDRAIDQASESEPRAALVIVDLSRVAIIPSLSLGPLMQIASDCARRGQKLKLAAAQPQVRNVFKITRMDEVFQFADTVESALE